MNVCTPIQVERYLHGSMSSTMLLSAGVRTPLLHASISIRVSLFFPLYLFYSICYFGGSFDPPTYGHMFSAASVLASGSVDEIWFSPCGGDPAPPSSSCLSQKSEFEKQEAARPCSSSSSCNERPSQNSLSPGDSSSHLHGKKARPLAHDSEERQRSPDSSLNGEREGDTTPPAVSASLPPSSSINKKLRLIGENEEKMPNEDVVGHQKSASSVKEGETLESDEKQRKKEDISVETAAKSRLSPSSSSSTGPSLQQNGTYTVRPDKTLSTPARLRLEMLKLAVSHFFGEAAVEVIDEEKEREEEKDRKPDADSTGKHDGCASQCKKPKIHVSPSPSSPLCFIFLFRGDV